ncbi:MAG TPA: methyltransferase domain-containing protein [Actinobacteria bacterium]|nr:methyltransferase domain-containing protein [Actinomycetota bacterium]
MSQVENKEQKNSALPKSPFPSWCSFLLIHPFRKRSFDRDKITAQAGVKPGQTVLEIGCGPGFFTETIAQKIGSSGKVIAQDVVPNMMIKLKKRMRRFPVTENIEPLLASSSHTGLDSGSVDLVFAANVFEEITKEGEMKATAGELYRVLKAEGSLYFGEHRVPDRILDTILDELKEAGFKRTEVDKNHIVNSALYKK